jgi:hypothetical protein
MGKPLKAEFSIRFAEFRSKVYDDHPWSGVCDRWYNHLTPNNSRCILVGHSVDTRTPRVETQTMERQWLRKALYVVLAFSAVMWFITLAASGSSQDLLDVMRTEAAKTRYLVVFVLSLAGLAASSGP